MRGEPDDLDALFEPASHEKARARNANVDVEAPEEEIVPEQREPADVYHVKGPGIEITYRRQDGRLEVAGEDSLLARADEAKLAAVETESGLLVTATLLPSDRAGRRHMLVILLPEVQRGRESAGGSHPVTGLAIRTTATLGGTSVPVGAVQQYSDAIRVEGTASFS